MRAWPHQARRLAAAVVGATDPDRPDVAPAGCRAPANKFGRAAGGSRQTTEALVFFNLSRLVLPIIADLPRA